MDKIRLILTIFFALSVFSSCFPGGSKTGQPETPSLPLTVTVNPIHGIRSAGGVISLPSATISLNGGDDFAEYRADFTVDGKAGSASPLYPGQKPRSLASSFSSCTEFGRHVIKGTVSRKAAADEQIPFEAEVWMRGVSLDFHEASIVSGKERSVFNPSVMDMFIGETGVLEYTYSPSSDYLEFAVISSEKDCISFGQRSFDEKTHTYSVPFSVTATGETTVTMSLTNGNETYSDSQKISCLSSSEKDYMFDISASVESGLLVGNPILVSVALTSGDVRTAYDVEITVDGTRAVQSSGVSLSEKKTFQVPASFATTGDHSILVRVSRSDGRRTVTKTLTVSVVGTPVEDVSASVAPEGGQAVPITGPMEMKEKKTYRLAIDIRPYNATVKDVLAVSSDASVLAVEKESDTRFNITAVSIGDATVTVTVKGVIDYTYEYRFNVIREVSYGVSHDAGILTFSFSDASLAGRLINLSWSMRYYGYCVSTEAEGKDETTEPELITYRRSTDKENASTSGYATLVAEGGYARIRVSVKEAYDRIVAMKEYGSTWESTGQTIGKDTVYRKVEKVFPYEFVIDTFNATATVDESFTDHRSFVRTGTVPTNGSFSIKKQ